MIFPNVKNCQMLVVKVKGGLYVFREVHQNLNLLRVGYTVEAGRGFVTFKAPYNSSIMFVNLIYFLQRVKVLCCWPKNIEDPLQLGRSMYHYACM